MGSYVAPTAAPVSSDWNEHAGRNPRSPEPGTDYACAYGTDLAMADAGTVAVIDTGNGGGEGRRMSVDLDDGRRVSYIHLSAINAWIGQRVRRDQTGVCVSGASGNGSDWYYGPHVHTTLWERPGMPYSESIDFERYIGSNPGNTEDDEMPIGYVKIQGKSGARRGGTYAVVSRPGAKPQAVYIGSAGPTDLEAVADDGSVSQLQTLIDGLQ
jgi:murein DD-endopeptidase MepM/ murein hydrolase activator NlpD